MRILDIPKECRPRERFLKQGPEALSDSELFAILLRTGTRETKNKEGKVTPAENVYETEEKIFLDAKERIQKATASFKQEDYAACLTHIHSSIEKALKKKLKIPPTINNIKIGPLIGFCIRNKVFPQMEIFLKEIDKKASIIDNAFKHQSYNPQKSEALEALSLGQEFVLEIEHSNANLPNNFHEELSKDIKFLDINLEK